MSIVIQKRSDEALRVEAEFEQQLMIHRPDVWKKIQEEREEANDMGFDEVVWKSPESLEEFYEIDSLLANSPLIEDFDTDLVSINPLDEIDLSELGEEE